VIKTKFEDAKGGNQKSYTKEGQAIKWPKGYLLKINSPSSNVSILQFEGIGQWMF
jgi:hypothetical protein